MKIGKILSATLVAALLLAAQIAGAAVISVNFVGGQGGSGGGGAGTVTTTAGAVQVGNWNNAIGATGNLPNPINDVGAVAATNVNWNSPNTWAATGATPGGGGSATMMSGYLDNFGGQTITVTGLGSQFTTLGYSVLVYFNEDSNGSHGAVATDNLGNNSGNRFAFQTGGAGAGFPLGGPNGFIGSTDPNSATSFVSNYVILTGLTGSTLTITGVNGTNGDGRTRPNGFQIVANTIPEPSSALLAGGALALGFIRRRRTA